MLPRVSAVIPASSATGMSDVPALTTSTIPLYGDAPRLHNDGASLGMIHRLWKDVLNGENVDWREWRAHRYQ